MILLIVYFALRMLILLDSSVARSMARRVLALVGRKMEASTMRLGLMIVIRIDAGQENHDHKI